MPYLRVSGAAVVSLCLALLAGGTRPAAVGAVTIVRGPYLQQPTDRSMVVLWATREAGSAEVRYATPTGTLSARATSRLVASVTTSLGYDYYQHEAIVTGLAPSTSYSYQPFVGGVAAAPAASFQTAPSRGAGSVSFIVFGDSGTGSPQQRQLAGVMAGDQFDFAMHVGDLAYGTSSGTGDATYPSYQSFLFDVYDWLPSVPFVPVEGNHDSRPSNGDGRAYLDLFSLPRNGATAERPDHAERYYSFDYGPVHFVALDTEFAFQDTARRSVQLTWLESDLAATGQPWIIAFYHRSPYSSGGEHGSDLTVRDAFGPLLERYGVDLVLTGHEHDYERTVPIRASTGEAVPYVVTGGGGAPLYAASTSSWTAYSASRHEYVKINVDSCQLTLNAVGLDGAFFDGMRLSRCTAPPPAPAPLPTGWSSSDVGITGAAGSASFASGRYTVNGAGADVWGTTDAFHFAYRSLEGDGSITARVTAVQPIANWVKAGVMMRGALTPNSAHGFMLVSSSKGTAFQRRPSDGNTTISTTGELAAAPRWVRLTRTGSTIAAFESADGLGWTQVASNTFAMGPSIDVGLAVSSHVAGTIASATFDSVTVTTGSVPPAPATGLPSGWLDADVGSVSFPGNATYDGTTYTVTGAGADVWGTADQFHYAYRPWTGNGTFVARVAFVQDVSAWVKAGVMVRETMAANSAHAFMLVSPGKGTAFQRRIAAGGTTTSTSGPMATAPRWVKLTRSGNSFSAYDSTDGVAWTLVGTETIPVAATVYVGLAVSSHNAAATATATFDNVSIR